MEVVLQELKQSNVYMIVLQEMKLMDLIHTRQVAG